MKKYIVLMDIPDHGQYEVGDLSGRKANALFHQLIENHKKDALTIEIYVQKSKDSKGNYEYTEVLKRWTASTSSLWYKEDVLYLGVYDTPHYDFAALGTSEDDVRSIMAKSWINHAKQTGADPEYFNGEDVNVTPIKVGDSIRDHSTFIKTSK